MLIVKLNMLMVKLLNLLLFIEAVELLLLKLLVVVGYIMCSKEL